MSDKNKLGRRAFLGAGLVGAGGTLGWLMGRGDDPAKTVKKRGGTKRKLDKRFEYDVSEFETTDPEKLLYTVGALFPTGMDRPKRLLVAPDDQVLVSGDKSIKFFEEGKVAQEISLSRPAHCMSIVGDELFVGFHNHFSIYRLDGTEKSTSERFTEEKTYFTSIAVKDEKVFLADAGRREVAISDRSGKVLHRFGKKDGTNPGFAVPSPYFDLMIAPDGNLRITNPGKQRMESYDLEGKFLATWGEPGMRIDRFCGCCNPIYFSMNEEGDFFTSEKGLTRINVYAADGTFKGAVAGPDMLVEDKGLARRALVDAKAGAGFDVGIDSKGRVVALDPYLKNIRYFEPKA